MNQPNSCSECSHEKDFPIKTNVHYSTHCGILQEMDKEHLMYCISKDERQVKRRTGCPLEQSK